MTTSFRKHLANTWVHSHEEDSSGTQVFRPADYDFPPARGRDRLGLEPDGALIKSVPGPDDRSTTQPQGSWRVEGKKLVLRHQDGRNAQYAIESVDPDKLVLRPL